jgi:hypothetical protein
MFTRVAFPGRCGEDRDSRGPKSLRPGGLMRRRAAVLCGVAVVVAGTLTAVPADASAPRTAAAVPAAKPTWKKCATDDYPTLSAPR